MIRIILISILVFVSKIIFAQGIDPNQIQPSPYKNGILRAVEKVYNEWARDTVYYYKHDSLSTSDTSGYNLIFRRSHDTIFIKDGANELYVTLPDTAQDVFQDSLDWDNVGDSLSLKYGEGVYYQPRIFTMEDYGNTQEIPNPRKYDMFIEDPTQMPASWYYYNGSFWVYLSQDLDRYNEGEITFESNGVDTVAIISNTNLGSKNNVIGGFGIDLNKTPLVDDMIFSADSTTLATRFDIDKMITPVFSDNAATYFNNPDSTFLHIILGDSKSSEPVRGIRQYKDLIIEDRGSDAGAGWGNFSQTPPSWMWYIKSGTTVNYSDSTSMIHKSLTLATNDYYELQRGTFEKKSEFSKITYWINEDSIGTLQVLLDGVPYDTIITDGEGVKKVEYNITLGLHLLRFKCLSGSVILTDYILEKEGKTFIWNIARPGVNSWGFYQAIDSDWQRIASYKPNLITIRLGANDKYAYNAGSYYVYLKRVIDSIRTNFPMVSLHLCTVELSNDFTFPLVSPIEDYNYQIYKLAREYSCQVIDIYNLWYDWQRMDSLGLADDNIHESAKGGDIIGQLYYKTVKYPSHVPQIVQGDLDLKQDVITNPVTGVGEQYRGVFWQTSHIIESPTGNTLLWNPYLQFPSFTGSNKTVAGFGTNTHTAYPWFTFNDRWGYLNMSWFARYNGSGFIKTMPLGNRAANFNNESGAFKFMTPEFDVDSGEVINFITRVQIDSTGEVLIKDLSGVNDRMVIANPFGILKTQSIPATVPDSTFIYEGYGINAPEGPTNTYTITADTFQLATPFDLSLKQDKIDAPIEGTGEVNRAAFWIEPDSLHSPANNNLIWNDSIHIPSVTGENKTVFTVGAHAHYGAPWFSFNDILGYMNLTWFARKNGDDWIKNTALVRGSPTNITNQSGGILFQTTAVDVDSLETFTFNDRLLIEKDGDIKIPDLAGVGTRLVVTNETGVLSSQTMPNAIPDSTVINAGYGINAPESPVNTYTITADTFELATPYDLSLKQNALTNPVTGTGSSNFGMWWNGLTTAYSPTNNNLLWNTTTDNAAFTGTNKTILNMGNNASATYPWFTISDASGYVNMGWFSRYNGTDWIKTYDNTIAGYRITAESSGIRLFHSSTAGLGEVVTWTDMLRANSTGVTLSSLAGSGSALTKVSDAGLFSRASSGTDYDPSITNEIQNLSYTASSRVLAIDGTGSTDATLPLFTSTEAGLVPLSGGGTTNFLRADGTWAATSGSVTTDKDLVTSTPLSGGQDNILVGTDSDVTIGLKAKVYEFAVANDSLVLSRNATLTNNALLANHATIGSTGILFEGSSADGNETLLTATNPTADRTIYLPNAGTNSYLTSYTSGTANFIPKLVDNTNFQFTNSIISESSNTITATSSISDLNILTIGRQFNYLNQSSYSNTGYSMHYFNRYRGSLSTPSVVTSGDILGALSYTGYDGTNLSEAARVDVKASGTISTGIVPSTYEIYTKTTTNGWNPRIAINNTGGITMSSLAGSGSRTVVADANGLLSATAALGTVTSIATNNGITGGTITTTGTIGLDYTATLNNNPIMQINETRMASSGVIFEGATANPIETLLTVADPTSVDKTITLPDATGTVAVSASAPLSNSATGNLTITQATTSTNGYLSSTDWNVFNNKQNALTNPVTGTGVATYVPRWTGTNTLSYFGNFTMTDDATNINLNTPGRNLRFNDAGSNIMFPSLADASSTKVAMIGQSTGQLYASAALYYNATEYGVQSLSGLPLVLNKAGNNVGVGKLPSVYFDVNGAASFLGDVKANATGSGFTHSAFWGYSTSYYRGIGMYYSGASSTWYTGNPYPNQSKYWGVYFKATANDAQTAQEAYNLMRIDSLGNVQIKKLDTDLTAPTTTGKKNVLISDASGNMSFRTSAPITRATNLSETTTTAGTWTKINFTSITFETDTNEMKLSLTGDTINIKQPGVYEIAFNAFAYMSTDVTPQILKIRVVKGFPDAVADVFQWEKKINYNLRENINFIDALNISSVDDLEFQYYWDSGATNCKIDDIVMTIKRL